DYNMSSPALETYARTRKYTKKNIPMNFSRDFSDFLFTHFAKGKVRQACTASLIAIGQKKITVKDMCNLLRNHNMPEPFTPGSAPMERICMHAGGLISSQTTGSMVAVLRKKLPPLVYFTATAAPCVSFFKPHILTEGQKKFNSTTMEVIGNDGTIDLYGNAKGLYDPATLWWKGEEIHRRIILNYATLSPFVQTERDVMEEKMFAEFEETWQKGLIKNAQKLCQKYRRTFIDRQNEFVDLIKKKAENTKNEVPAWYRLYWKRMNRKANFPFP
ncbi:MAG: hypothetical protein N2316_13115, partial [Spirochaetes bacterium]|nr:hypothetical protein [Spirochaetota bacterium]